MERNEILARKILESFDREIKDTVWIKIQTEDFKSERLRKHKGRSGFANRYEEITSSDANK